ncbi:hypothetical protein RND71_008255 [Anisodus tanguticus]|uniref:Uncharacterized protein n=1 Tax=Anisodus tanguticus TaxID=243964 RepID=A0AAE1SNH6_9SOLA|nr:hypothetical protein RND71_008255 [Anisodus tanguticus]
MAMAVVSGGRRTTIAVFRWWKERGGDERVDDGGSLAVRQRSLTLIFCVSIISGQKRSNTGKRRSGDVVEATPPPSPLFATVTPEKGVHCVFYRSDRSILRRTPLLLAPSLTVLVGLKLL